MLTQLSPPPFLFALRSVRTSLSADDEMASKKRKGGTASGRDESHTALHSSAVCAPPALSSRTIAANPNVLRHLDHFKADAGRGRTDGAAFVMDADQPMRFALCFGDHSHMTFAQWAEPQKSRQMEQNQMSSELIKRGGGAYNP